ncbi:MAG: fatty acid metabolism transcriptional regulator FadR [Ardenticatenales bacterium]|nr:fatty acid metabolism transcriptional regulator FadR [Ardenticatenales bacterium]
MTDWVPPIRPAEHAEQMLVGAILDGTFPAGTTLPGERELAGQLGVTRPTLREALRRLERDGWLTVQQGKSTRVNDYEREGGLNVLSALIRHNEHLAPSFILHLLDVREVMAPAYIRLAVERVPHEVMALLAEGEQLPDTPERFAAFDWRLHHALTVASGNPIYTMILNGFAGFYEDAARVYFASTEARAASRRFYRALMAAAQAGEGDPTEQLVRFAMQESIHFWCQVHNLNEMRGALR